RDPDVVVEPAQQLVAPVQQRHGAAEAGEDAGELDRDVAAADDQNALRLTGQIEDLVRGYAVLAARNARLQGRMRADGHQDEAGPDALAGREPHRVRVFDDGANLGDHDAGVFERGAIESFQTGDLAVLVGDQGRPIEARLRNRPAVAGRVRELVREAAGVDHQLLGHAAPDHARAAEAVFFGEHHL